MDLLPPACSDTNISAENSRASKGNWKVHVNLFDKQVINIPNSASFQYLTLVWAQKGKRRWHCIAQDQCIITDSPSFIISVQYNRYYGPLARNLMVKGIEAEYISTKKSHWMWQHTSHSSANSAWNWARSRFGICINWDQLYKPLAYTKMYFGFSWLG